jgi:hypothetical protein
VIEAGWLLLLLFLGVCALIVVGLLWPSFRSAVGVKTVDKIHAFNAKAPLSPRAPKTATMAQAVRSYVAELLQRVGRYLVQLGYRGAGGESADALFLIFTPEEMGRIAVLVVKGVPRKEAIRAMPRYSRKQHQEYAAFYNTLREVMDNQLRKS